MITQGRAGVRCGAPGSDCGRRAEVAVHLGVVVVLACLSDGVRMARAVEDNGREAIRVVLLDDQDRRQLTIGPRGA